MDEPAETDALVVNPPELLVFGMSGGFLGCTVNVATDPQGSNIGALRKTQLVMSPSQETLNSRVVSTLIQEFGFSQADATSLVPSGMTPLVPSGGGGTGVEEAPQDGSTYGRLNATWTQVPSLGSGGELDVSGDLSVDGTAEFNGSAYFLSPDTQFMSGFSAQAGDVDISNLQINTQLTFLNAALPGSAPATINQVWSTGGVLMATMAPAAAAGATIAITAQSATVGSSAGGTINITGGDGGPVNGSGGPITIRAGKATNGSGAGGALTLVAGAPYTSGNGNGGATSIYSGSGSNSAGGGNGGLVTIQAGSGYVAGKNAGSVLIQSGAANSGSTPGKITLDARNGGSIVFTNLPNNDPAATNTVWLASGVLMLSGSTPPWLSRTGVADGSDATAGQIGEFLSAQRLSTAALALTTNISAIVTTLSLTAGDWDVWASLGCNTTTSTGQPVVHGWINPAGGATPPSIDQIGGNAIWNPTNQANQLILSIPAMRVSLAATTTISFGTMVTFGNGTYAAWGQIMARRRR